ncbi:hypothetical protein A2U01_0118851, partial [Trifolium medium]|nr:hypothetical protein [Trifolium medium]
MEIPQEQPRAEGEGVATPCHNSPRRMA